MSSSLFLQQCPVCLVHLMLIVFVMGVGVRTAAALWSAVFRTCPILVAAFLCNCRPTFSPQV